MKADNEVWKMKDIKIIKERFNKHGDVLKTSELNALGIWRIIDIWNIKQLNFEMLHLDW